MAIYHCSVKIGSRSKGQSAIAAAAYRSGTVLINEETGQVSDYSRKCGVVHQEISLCANAPEEYRDRETLWNAVHRVEKSKDAQLWREIEVALPKEFSQEEQIETVREYVRGLTVQGMCADWSIHDKGDGNPHAHIMLTMRSIQEDGTWASKCRKVYLKDENGEKIPLIDSKTNQQKVDKNHRKQWKTTKERTTNWDEPERIEEWRSAWEDVCNKRLAPEARIDHRSYERQHKEIEPTIHEGYAAREMEKRGEESDRCRINREIKQRNIAVPTLADKVKGLEVHLATLNEHLSLNQFVIDHTPDDKKNLDEYFAFKPIYDALCDFDAPESAVKKRAEKKKSKYEEIHKDELERYWSVREKLVARFGDDDALFPSNQEQIQSLCEIARDECNSIREEIASDTETLLYWERKRTASVKLPKEMGEILADNFDHAGCWYEVTAEETGNGERNILVSFDKTDTETLHTLQDTFPRTAFPFAQWGADAAKWGFENPLNVYVKEDSETTTHAGMTLEEYIRSGEAYRAIDECPCTMLQQFFGIKEALEELLPHTRLTIIDTDSKEIRESAALLHWAELQNIKAVSRALNILMDQFSGEVETYPQLEKYCDEILPARCERLNNKTNELDKARSVVQRYLKQRQSTYWTERKGTSNKERYDKRHASEKAEFDKARKAFKQLYPNWDFKKNKLADEKERLTAMRMKIYGIYDECREKLEQLKPLLSCLSKFAERHHIQTENPSDEILPEMKGAAAFSNSFAEALQANFEAMGCKCERQEMPGGRSKVSFDKTDATTLQVLYDTFPAITFPFEEWGKEAEEMGEENPLYVQVKTGEEAHPFKTLKAYIEDKSDKIDGSPNSASKETKEAKQTEPKKTGKVLFSQKDRAKAKEQLDDIHRQPQKTDMNKRHEFEK